MRTLLLLTTVLALSSCRALAPPSGREVDAESARRAIEQRIADWARWTAAGDIDSIADIFTEDAWEADPNQPPIAGRVAIAAHWRRGMSRGRWEFDPHVEEIIVRDSIAVERSSYSLRYSAHVGADGPPSFEDRGSWVNVWRRGEDGQWRILWTIAASELPSPAER